MRFMVAHPWHGPGLPGQDPAAARAAQLLGALPSGAATGAAGGEVPQAER